MAALAVAGIAVVAAGCGSDGESTATTAAPVTTEAPATTATNATTTAASTTSAPATTSASTTTTPADTTPGACREITHALGTACVPADPQRIVVLDTLLVLPTLIDAGAPVVGSVSVYDVGDPFPEFVDAPDDLAVVGSLQSPNLELIAAAKPDLIIGADLVMQPIQEQLEAIAPSVATTYAFYNPAWRDDALLVGDAAGVRDEVQASIDELNTRIATEHARLTAGGEGPTLTRVDVFTGMPLYYELACTAFGSVLLEAGIQQPAAQVADCTPTDYQSILKYPSAEQLDVLDADAIVAYQQQAGGGDVGASPLDVLAANPLWGQLPAVQAGRTRVVGDAWGLGVSVPAFLLMLDDLRAIFP